MKTPILSFVFALAQSGLAALPAQASYGPCSQLIITQDGYSLQKWLGGTYDPVIPHCQKLGAEAAGKDQRCLWLIEEAREALRTSNPSRLNYPEQKHCATLKAFLAEMGVE